MTSKSEISNPTPIKVVCVGNGAVGKTCMLIAYRNRRFAEEYVPTVFDNYINNISLNGKEYMLDLWDTAGQEEFDRLRPLAYRETDVFLVSFSMSSKNSLADIETRWIPELRHYCPETKFILVGMKNDLVPKEMRTGKTYVITREKYSKMYEIVIKYWIRNCSKKSNKFEVFDNFPSDLIKVVLKFCENIRAQSEKAYEEYSKNYNVENFVTQSEIDEMIKKISPSDYISCSALTGDGIDQIFETVVRLYNLQTIQQNKPKKRRKCQIL